MTNYPVCDGSHDQERRSKKAFITVVPEELFIIRQEFGDDYGTDIILELKMVGKYAINYRIHAQLKDKANSQRNSDGSLSYQVPIKTINYLYNQPNSLFIIYLEDENTFVWEWISVIVQKAKSDDIDLENTEKDHVTFRFSKVLDRQAFILIHSKAFKSGEMVKKLSDLTLFSVPDESLLFSYDKDREEIKPVQEYIDLCKKYGIAMANEGEYNILEYWFGKIPDLYKNDAEYSLVVSYAKMNNGNYYDAIGWLPRGARAQGLVDNHKELVDYMEITLLFALGYIDFNEYSSKLSQLKKKYPDSLYTLQLELREKREVFFETFRNNKSMLNEASKALSDTIDRLKSISTTNTNLNTYIRLVEFEIEGFKWLTDVSHQYYIIKGRQEMGHQFSLQERVQMAKTAINRNIALNDNYFNLYNSIENEALKSILYISYANFQMYFCSNSSIFTEKSIEDYREILEKTGQTLQYVIGVLQDKGYVYECLRGCIALSNCLCGLGEKQEAFKMAERTILNAQTFGINDISESAKNILDGHSIFDLKEYLEKSFDEMSLSKLSEDELYKYALEMIELMGIPKERLGNVLIDLKWIQDDESEKVNFCKHLQVIQDLSHTVQLKNAYSINPNRSYICSLLNYRSLTSGTDRDKILIRFKSDFCLGCNKKEPGQLTR